MFIEIEVYRGDDNIFVAACPEFNLFTHANTQEEAVKKLKADIVQFVENSEDYARAQKDIEFSLIYYSSRYPQIH